MDQEGVDDGVKASLSKIGRELAEAQLLGHKDKGIRAWVGCCVVDILRLCAPDAPYTLKQLKVRPCKSVLLRQPAVLCLRYKMHPLTLPRLSSR